jgi:Holliday junction resolvase
MVNKNYVRGRAKEYRLKKKLEAEGYIVLRTAGSHGFADLIAVHPHTFVINFVQSKPRSLGKNQVKKLEKEYEWINDRLFRGKFEVR